MGEVKLIRIRFRFVTAAGEYSDADEDDANRQLTRSVGEEAKLAMKSPEDAKMVLATVEWANRMKTRRLYKAHAAHLVVAKVLRCVFLTSGLQSIKGNDTDESATQA